MNRADDHADGRVWCFHARDLNPGSHRPFPSELLSCANDCCAVYSSGGARLCIFVFPKTVEDCKTVTFAAPLGLRESMVEGSILAEASREDGTFCRTKRFVDQTGEPDGRAGTSYMPLRGSVTLNVFLAVHDCCNVRGRCVATNRPSDHCMQLWARGAKTDRRRIYTHNLVSLCHGPSTEEATYCCGVSCSRKIDSTA